MGMADMERELEQLVEEFRSETEKQRNEFLAHEALLGADGDISIKTVGQHVAMHVKGNVSAIIVAAYCLMDMTANKIPSLTFEDVIEIAQHINKEKHSIRMVEQ